MRRLLQVGSLAGPLAVCLAAGARADTVYLKNGAWIDGRARTRGDVVEIEIGKLGKVEVKLEDVYEIERNNRTGEYQERSGSGTPGERPGEPAAGSIRRGALEEREPAEGAAKPEKGAEETGASSGAQPPGEEEPSEIDPELKSKIEQLVLDIQRQKAQYRVRAERQLKSIGAPVVPFVVPLCKNSSELTRIAAFRILEEVGDDHAIDACLDGLADTNEYAREYANKALKRITGQDFGFVAVAAPRRREFAETKWREWWEREKKSRTESRRAGRR